MTADWLGYEFEVQPSPAGGISSRAAHRAARTGFVAGR